MSPKELIIKVVTLEKTVYGGGATRISIPTSEGFITVLPEHEPLIGLLAPGVMLVTLRDGSQEKIIVTTGFFEVKPMSEIIILADTADAVGDIDVDAFKRSKDAATKALEEGVDINELEVAHLEDVIAREAARIDVADRHLGMR